MTPTSDRDMLDAVKLKLDAARWWLLKYHPFYAQLAMKLADVLTPRPDVPTAATDGKRIYWNPAFAARLTPEQTRGVLLHETLHPAHLHPWRLPHDKRGNVAGDYEINLIVSKVPGCELPPDALLDTQYANMACEEILAALPDDPPGDPSSCGTFLAPGDDGQAADQASDPATQAQASAALEASWQAAVASASHLHQAGRGDMPGDMATLLARVLAHPVNWRQELLEFAREATSQRNDWQRAARRHATARVLIPRKRADDLALVLFVRDTSGSIDADTCAAYTAMIDTCVAELGCEAIVLDCDTSIQAEHRLTPGMPCPLTMCGGGGTAFAPPFIRAQELLDAGERIAGVVYLTDLDGSFPSDPGIATLWLSTSGVLPVPFGRVVPVGS